MEIIYRLPQTETLKEYAPDLCKMLMYLLKVENEDNAVVCVKIIIDLHRTFRHSLEDQVQPFLDIVQEIFKNMEQTVKDVFDAPSTPIGAATVRVERYTYEISYLLIFVYHIVAWIKSFIGRFATPQFSSRGGNSRVAF